jgi:O-acetyl-ADP-ribose deacetylase (regulator of RNase III)
MNSSRRKDSGGAGYTSLDVAEYRSHIQLDEPFDAPPPAQETEVTRAALVSELLQYLSSEDSVKSDTVDPNVIPSSYQEMRRMLRALLTVRGPDPLPSWFHAKFDSLLQRESRERTIEDSRRLPRISQVFPESPFSAAETCALWQGDITALRIDAIVNAANEYLLGCFLPFHECIDNVIHTWAGPRVREDCNTIMRIQSGREGTGRAKVTRGYNLPSRYILHTVGPIVTGSSGQVSAEHEQQLASCYSACLELATRVPTIRSVAFCCISTGVFGFPQGPAARVAVNTVQQWLADHPNSLDLVVFNVFGHKDYALYQSLLAGN